MTFAELEKPIRSKIGACEDRQETWKQDHELAKLVYHLEDLLNDVVECYDDLQRLDALFLNRLAENVHAYDEGLDNAIIELAGRVHQLLESINTGLLPWFEEKFCSVENVDRFRDRLERAKESAKYGYRSDAHFRNQVLIEDICQSLGLSRAS